MIESWACECELVCVIQGIKGSFEVVEDPEALSADSVTIKLLLGF